MDQGNDTCWMGSAGGMMPPGMNHFHGFRASGPIEPATPEVDNEIRFGEDGKAYDVETGDELALLAMRSDNPGGPDDMTTKYWLNPKTDTVYRTRAGGIGNLDEFVDQVMRLAHG